MRCTGASLQIFVIVFLGILAGCSQLRLESSTASAAKDHIAESANRQSQVVGGIPFVRIPAGRFSMGRSASQPPGEYTVCELPAHEVVITHDFLMGKYEITRGQFREFVNATGYLTDAERSGAGCNSLKLVDGSIQRLPQTIWTSPGFHQHDQHPVTCVSWDDATAFCDWISERNNKVIRLPTEAEWEYACRAGSGFRFSSGDTWDSLDGMANVGDQALCRIFSEAMGAAAFDDGFAFTSPVGQFAANAFGVHDMHGNVGEWCIDWFSQDFYRVSPKQDPQGPMKPTEWHVVRGGSWYNSPESCRSACRHDGIPTMASTTNGFRVVMELDD